MLTTRTLLMKGVFQRFLHHAPFIEGLEPHMFSPEPPTPRTLALNSFGEIRGKPSGQRQDQIHQGFNLPFSAHLRVCTFTLLF